MIKPDMDEVASKVPAVTLGFWAIKILATTLGENAGDTLSMSLDMGYLVSTAIFGGLLALFIAAQIKARTFHPALYWTTILASTTAGTTLADFATRSLGIGYSGGSLLLLTLVLGSLAAWKATLGRIASDDLRGMRPELFYWVTITFSQTLGTALGDWLADTGGRGYLGAAVIFALALAGVAALYRLTRTSRVLLFWAAFVLTRPLGAAVGDFLDKPLASGGLDLSRPLASAVLLGAIALLLVVIPQRAGRHPA